MSKITILLLLGIWAGLIIGISFIEAPLKFQAPGITIALGVGIGKLVFNFSNIVQLVLLIVSLIFFVYKKLLLSSRFFVSLLIIFSILMIQTLYLLPALDVRAAQVMQGLKVESSFHHLAFVLCEVGKLITLVVLFFKTYLHA